MHDLSDTAGRSDALAAVMAQLKAGDYIATIGDASDGAPESWAETADRLCMEAHATLEGLKLLKPGRRDPGAPRARDLAPFAQEWAQAMAAHFDLRLTVASADPASWAVSGSAPNGDGPG